MVDEPESERVVGISSYNVDPRTGLADVAYIVDPAWQGVGIGGLLHARMIEYARRHGVRGPALRPRARRGRAHRTPPDG